MARALGIVVLLSAAAATEEGRRQNRRIEILLAPSGREPSGGDRGAVVGIGTNDEVGQRSTPQGQTVPN